jgi:hypothetical protein
MSDIKQELKRKRYLRAKSLKIIAGENFTTTVLNAATYLTIHANEISSIGDQPDVTAMRAPLLPAYKMIASGLSDLLKNPDITFDKLSGLKVDLLPALGSYSFEVNYLTPTGQYQGYNVKVSAQDHKNTFLRLNERHGPDYAQAFMEQI